MAETQYGPPHSAFNADLYRWTLGMPVNKWYPTTISKKMSQTELIDCIKYLVCCGEPLRLMDDESHFCRDDYTPTDYIK